MISRGHEDFVRTMVAGASGIDLVLLVVDAAQGPQPQHQGRQPAQVRQPADQQMD